jgi:hypothetical protein
MADVSSNLHWSEKVSYVNEEFCSDTCLKCIYLEERLQVMSELSSLQLAIKLLYTESNVFHAESEVRSHSVSAHDVTLLPSTWCTIQPKYIKMGDKAGRADIPQSTEPVKISNRFAALSNVSEYSSRSDETLSRDIRRMDSTFPRPRNLMSASQWYISKQRKYRYNQHPIQQEAT